jgi:hypothetical protein
MSAIATRVVGGWTYAKVPWVDEKGIFHVLADAHELTENYRALLCRVLRNHKFHAGGVHTITQRGDDSEICHTEESVELVLLQTLVATRKVRVCSRLACKKGLLVVDRNKVEASVLSVDVCNDLTDETLKLGGVGEGRAGDLNHDDVANPFRVVV